MLLSIIIPVYNVEHYLRECLDSIFSQDLTDCEVIAVNDGSTDGSRDVLGEYKVKYPDGLTIVDKANGGLSSARNVGVNYAKGDYFYFSDSDDWLKPHAINAIKGIIGESEGADVIYLDCIVTDTGKRRGCNPQRQTPLMDFRRFFYYAYKNKIDITPNAFSYVYSNSYWKKSGLHYEEGIKYEDAFLKYQLFVREDGKIKAVHLEEPFYIYRIGREGSISTKMTLKNFTDKQFIRKSADALWTSLGINDVAYYHMLFDACTYMLYEAYQSGFIEEHKKFWDKDDIRIMRKGVSNDWEYGFWLLAKLSPEWMARYYANDLPAKKRKLTNRYLTVFRYLYSRNNCNK